MEYKNTIITPKTDFPMKAGLPARERIIFVRRYWYGMSAEEIAAGLNTTRNAVWMQLSRTRNRFRTFLNERGYQV